MATVGIEVNTDPKTEFVVEDLHADLADREARRTGSRAPGRIRTCDLRIRSPLLYPLSYRRRSEG
jgi:hypothetical protein